MDPGAFRAHAHALADWIANYLQDPTPYPVLPRISPGDIRAALPAEAPEDAEPFDRVFADFERVLVPGLTHWNHPGFLGYFAITASPPGVLAEFLAAALNQQAMLWRTSPAATELEEVTLAWLRRLVGLPDVFDGVIYDTASISTLHALAAARQVAVPGVRTQGLTGRDLPRLRVYCSDQAHSSIDKAAIMLGLGIEGVRRVPSDDGFRLRPDALSAAVAADRRNGEQPMAVVATIGTTSSTSVDPVKQIAAVCKAEGLWLHVDAAYAGSAAIVPALRPPFTGWELADSIVINPHKWLFTPFDLSAFYCRRPDVLRAALALVPAYLETPEDDAVRNLMDTGIQLGRRFRALKLWAVLRCYGAARLRDAIAGHISLAREFASWVDADPFFERLAEVPFSVVCFRANPKDGRPGPELDALNERLMHAVNATGEVFLSHTRLRGALALRLAVGHLHTERRHVARAWALLRDAAARLGSV